MDKSWVRHPPLFEMKATIKSNTELHLKGDIKYLPLFQDGRSNHLNILFKTQKGIYKTSEDIISYEDEYDKWSISKDGVFYFVRKLPPYLDLFIYEEFLYRLFNSLVTMARQLMIDRDKDEETFLAIDISWIGCFADLESVIDISTEIPLCASESRNEGEAGDCIKKMMNKMMDCLKINKKEISK